MSTGRSPGLPLDWARGSYSDSVPSLSSHIGERKLRTVEDQGILRYSKPPKVFFVSASEASRFGFYAEAGVDSAYFVKLKLN